VHELDNDEDEDKIEEEFERGDPQLGVGRRLTCLLIRLRCMLSGAGRGRSSRQVHSDLFETLAAPTPVVPLMRQLTPSVTR